MTVIYAQAAPEVPCSMDSYAHMSVYTCALLCKSLFICIFLNSNPRYNVYIFIRKWAAKFPGSCLICHRSLDTCIFFFCPRSGLLDNMLRSLLTYKCFFQMKWFFGKSNAWKPKIFLYWLYIILTVYNNILTIIISITKILLKIGWWLIS